jgi:tRNA (adenine37-N6)-methyltransferase
VIHFTPIGVVRSPFTQQAGTPIQPAFARGVRGALELEPRFAEALKDLEGFQRIWAIYHLDRAVAFQPLVVPYLDREPRGLFATRSPCRPNPIGLSLLELVCVDGARLEVEGVDVLDGTPLLDIKPYVPAFDAVTPSRAGWFDGAAAARQVADDRFERK